ncbi:hypothetical protein KUCAC02_006197 [Chaenocephalus aceratus]|nr:hypothetical protein KUCAC02_006197 [Chaenocephalus aceratus]
MELANEDNDNIRIHSAYQASRRAMLQGIKQINHNPGTSSWLHGSMKWLVSVPTTLTPDVMKTCLPTGQAVDVILLESKVKSSCLFMGSSKTSGQFLGSFF